MQQVVSAIIGTTPTGLPRRSSRSCCSTDAKYEFKSTKSQLRQAPPPSSRSLSAGAGATVPSGQLVWSGHSARFWSSSISTVDVRLLFALPQARFAQTSHLNKVLDFPCWKGWVSHINPDEPFRRN